MVAHVLASTDAEYLIQLLEGESLGLRDEEKYQEPQNDTPGPIPSKRPLGFESGEKMRPGETQDEIEAPGRSRGK